MIDETQDPVQDPKVIQQQKDAYNRLLNITDGMTPENIKLYQNYMKERFPNGQVNDLDLNIVNELVDKQKSFGYKNPAIEPLPTTVVKEPTRPWYDITLKDVGTSFADAGRAIAGIPFKAVQPAVDLYNWGLRKTGIVENATSAGVERLYTPTTTGGKVIQDLGAIIATHGTMNAAASAAAKGLQGAGTALEASGTAKGVTGLPQVAKAIKASGDVLEGVATAAKGQSASKLANLAATSASGVAAANIVTPEASGLLRQIIVATNKDNPAIHEWLSGGASEGDLKQQIVKTTIDVLEGMGVGYAVGKVIEKFMGSGNNLQKTLGVDTDSGLKPNTPEDLGILKPTQIPDDQWNYLKSKYPGADVRPSPVKDGDIRLSFWHDYQKATTDDGKQAVIAYYTGKTTLPNPNFSASNVRNLERTIDELGNDTRVKQTFTGSFTADPVEVNALKDVKQRFDRITGYSIAKPIDTDVTQKYLNNYLDRDAKNKVLKELLSDIPAEPVTMKTIEKVASTTDDLNTAIKVILDNTKSLNTTVADIKRVPSAVSTAMDTVVVSAKLPYQFESRLNVIKADVMRVVEDTVGVNPMDDKLAVNVINKVKTDVFDKIDVATDLETLRKAKNVDETRVQALHGAYRDVIVQLESSVKQAINASKSGNIKNVVQGLDTLTPGSLASRVADKVLEFEVFIKDVKKLAREHGWNSDIVKDKIGAASPELVDLQKYAVDRYGLLSDEAYNVSPEKMYNEYDKFISDIRNKTDITDYIATIETSKDIQRSLIGDIKDLSDKLMKYPEADVAKAIAREDGSDPVIMTEILRLESLNKALASLRGHTEAAVDRLKAGYDVVFKIKPLAELEVAEATKDAVKKYYNSKDFYNDVYLYQAKTDSNALFSGNTDPDYIAAVKQVVHNMQESGVDSHFTQGYLDMVSGRWKPDTHFTEYFVEKTPDGKFKLRADPRTGKGTDITNMFDAEARDVDEAARANLVNIDTANVIKEKLNFMKLATKALAGDKQGIEAIKDLVAGDHNTSGYITGSIISLVRSFGEPYIAVLNTKYSGMNALGGRFTEKVIAPIVKKLGKVTPADEVWMYKNEINSSKLSGYLNKLKEYSIKNDPSTVESLIVTSGADAANAQIADNLRARLDEANFFDNFMRSPVGKTITYLPKHGASALETSDLAMLHARYKDEILTGIATLNVESGMTVEDAMKKAVETYNQAFIDGQSTTRETVYRKIASEVASDPSLTNMSDSDKALIAYKRFQAATSDTKMFDDITEIHKGLMNRYVNNSVGVWNGAFGKGVSGRWMTSGLKSIGSDVGQIAASPILATSRYFGGKMIPSLQNVKFTTLWRPNQQYVSAVDRVVKDSLTTSYIESLSSGNPLIRARGYAVAGVIASLYGLAVAAYKSDNPYEDSIITPPLPTNKRLADQLTDAGYVPNAIRLGDRQIPLPAPLEVAFSSMYELVAGTVSSKHDITDIGVDEVANTARKWFRGLMKFAHEGFDQSERFIATVKGDPRAVMAGIPELLVGAYTGRLSDIIINEYAQQHDEDTTIPIKERDMSSIIPSYKITTDLTGKRRTNKGFGIGVVPDTDSPVYKLAKLGIQLPDIPHEFEDDSGNKVNLINTYMTRSDDTTKNAFEVLADLMANTKIAINPETSTEVPNGNPVTLRDALAVIADATGNSPDEIITKSNRAKKIVRIYHNKALDTVRKELGR